jgi:hypothetical protein
VGLVVGIFPGSDPQALQQALASQAGIDPSKIRVVTSAAPSQAHEDAPFDFIHVAEAQLDNSLSDDMTRGTGIMSDGGGTGVPGMNTTNSLSSFVTAGGSNYLSGLGIPDDEADNFNDAISEGRSVVVYDVNGNASQIASALSSAGLRNVRSY